MRECCRDAYTAGLVDADGTIAIHLSGQRGGKGRIVFKPLVQVYNTKLDLLEWLRGIYGGRIEGDRPHRANKGYKPCYRWCLNGAKNLRRFLPVIKPYLRVKLDRLLILESFLETYLDSKPGSLLSEDLYQKRVSLYTASRIQNLRGQA